MATQTKEEILANLLKNSLGMNLKRLEAHTTEHIKTLEQTRKSFNAHQKSIKDLITRVKIAKELKEAKEAKEKEKKLLELKRKQTLQKSHTSKNFRAKTSAHKANLNKTLSYFKTAAKNPRPQSMERKTDNKFKSKRFK